jgi:hypothetical protein
VKLPGIRRPNRWIAATRMLARSLQREAVQAQQEDARDGLMLAYDKLTKVLVCGEEQTFVHARKFEDCRIGS